MNAKEMPHHLREQAAGRVADSTSVDNVSTSANERQGIFDMLPVGEENAIPSRTLAQMAGCKSVRELQSRIADERAEGRLILSTCRNGGGYYLPSDGPAGQAEIAAFVATLRSRALNTLRVLKAAKSALEGVDGQLDLFDDLWGV